VSFAVVPVVKDTRALGFGDFLELTHGNDPDLKNTVYDIYRTGVKPIALTSDESRIPADSAPIKIVFHRMIQQYLENPEQFGWGKSPLCPIARGSQMANSFKAQQQKFQEDGYPEGEIFQLAAMPHNPDKPTELQIGIDFRVISDLYRRILDESRMSGESEIRIQRNLEHTSPRLINISQFCFLHEEGSLFLVAPIRRTSKGIILATPSFFKEECSPEVLGEAFLNEVCSGKSDISPERLTDYLSKKLLPKNPLLKPTTIGAISMMMGQDDRGGFKFAQHMEVNSKTDLRTLQEILFQENQSNQFDVLGLFKIGPNGALPMKAEIIVRNRAQIDFNPHQDHSFISRTLDAYMMCLSTALSF
jgi:hypothetical protein